MNPIYKPTFYGVAAPTKLDSVVAAGIIAKAQSIVLGPRSDIDQVLISAQGADYPFLVSVGAPTPLIDLSGGFKIISTYPAAVQQIPTLDTVNLPIPAALELHFYQSPPPYVPTKRGIQMDARSLKLAAAQPNIPTFCIPFFGRRNYLVSVKPDATTGGMNWQLFMYYPDGSKIALNDARAVAANTTDAQEEVVGGEAGCWLGVAAWGDGTHQPTCSFTYIVSGEAGY